MLHGITRRSFAATSVSAASLAAAHRLFGEPAPDSTEPAPELEKLGAVALAEAKKQGATYADLRIARFRNQFSGYRLSPQRGSNTTNEVPFVTDQNTFGFGVRVRNLSYDRFWAEKAGKKPTPSPVNLVLDGQDNTLPDLIKSVDRGLLVTRLWYIRVVQPKTWQLTGLTRDGVFLIENGKVTDPVTNFRWNESPAEVLQRTTKLTQPVRVTNDETGSNMAPALITTDFNFTSVSDAV